MTTKDKMALNKVFQRGIKGEGALSVMVKTTATKSPSKKRYGVESDSGQEDCSPSDGDSIGLDLVERSVFTQTA
jgi:hypothetical protein